MKKLFLTTAVLLGITATAQVKIGSNPTNITAGNIFEVEGTSGNKLNVTQTGKIGVATPPSVDFHVANTVANTNAEIRISAWGTGNAVLSLFDEGVNGGMLYYDRTSTRLTLKNANTDAISILVNGNVGIGTTDPLAKLDIQESATAFAVNAIISRSMAERSFAIRTYTGASTSAIGDITNQLGQAYTEAAAMSEGFNFIRGNTTNDGQLAFLTSQTERMRILANGNVGIGVVVPFEKLQVAGGAQIGGYLSVTTAGATYDPYGAVSVQRPADANTYGYYGMTKSGTTTWGMGINDLNGLSFDHFATGGQNGTLPASPAFNISTIGNVGIGTKSPATELDVRGTVQFMDAAGTKGIKIVPSFAGGSYIQTLDPGAGAPYGDLHIDGSKIVLDNKMGKNTILTGIPNYASPADAAADATLEANALFTTGDGIIRKK